MLYRPPHRVTHHHPAVCTPHRECSVALAHIHRPRPAHVHCIHRRGKTAPAPQRHGADGLVGIVGDEAGEEAVVVDAIHGGNVGAAGRDGGRVRGAEVGEAGGAGDGGGGEEVGEGRVAGVQGDDVALVEGDDEAWVRVGMVVLVGGW